MFLLLFLVWIIFNGQITLEIALIGLAISGVIYAFCCKFLNLSLKKDIAICKRAGQVFKYLAVLLVEIVKSNITVIKIVTSSRYDVEPAIVHFKADLKSETALVILSDSITLTPGTITVLQEGDELTVHCLDKSLAEGLADSVFVKLLQEFEKPLDK